MKLEKVSNSKAYKQNPRIHNQKHIFEIARSIKEFGFTNPILLDEEGVILAGRKKHVMSLEKNN